MELSPEGVRFVSKAAVFVVLLLVAAFFRTLVGPNPRRQYRMLFGTLGGLALGVWVATPLSQLLGSDVSSLSAIGGMIVGWTIAYQFARRIPRYAE